MQSSTSTLWFCNEWVAPSFYIFYGFLCRHHRVANEKCHRLVAKQQLKYFGIVQLELLSWFIWIERNASQFDDKQKSLDEFSLQPKISTWSAFTSLRNFNSFRLFFVTSLCRRPILPWPLGRISHLFFLLYTFFYFFLLMKNSCFIFFLSPKK